MHNAITSVLSMHESISFEKYYIYESAFLSQSKITFKDLKAFYIVKIHKILVGLVLECKSLVVLAK